jgi:hypothetical protein
MSRTTLVHRDETPEGARYEWGHLYVAVYGKPGEVRTFVPGENGNPHDGMHLSTEHANVMSDLLRAAVVNAGGSSCGGKTLYDMMWDEMMVVTDRLIGAGEDKDPDDVGAARSLAWVIAVMQNPYLPNVDSVREQVMERWEREDAAEAAYVAASPVTRRAGRGAVRAKRRARNA